MALKSGTQLGPYEIIAMVGAGGMGEVYRAKDTRLDRTVAIKVLSANLSSNPELKQRFDREARTISNLSHPNICALYDLGHQDGVDFLVMEFLEGETLSDRLMRGSLPMDQVLRFGMQIADALDKAHRQGVIHRDLKPGNIMITRSGIKLLDFGLAKIQPAAIQTIPGVSALPTEHQTPLTAEGSILGTLQYMSPEQLEGRESDTRTDIFAFGLVLYEMATAKRAFTGKSQASLIAAILSSEPVPISTIQPMSPPGFDRVVKTCLAKDPEDRWQTSHDVMLELKWIAEGGSQAGIPATVVTHRKNRETIAWILVGLLVFALVVALFSDVFQREPPKQSWHVSVLAPEVGSVWHSAISNDGSMLAITGIDAAGKSRLWFRSLAASAATPLPDTDDAMWPFWSPDNRYIGFFAGNKLKKIAIPNGRPESICETDQAEGATWNKQGIILFTNKNVLYRVSQDGGTPTAVTRLDPAQESHRWPWFLPDGNRFLFLGDANRREDHHLMMASLDQPEPKKLITPFISTIRYSSGYIYFVRGGTLMAQSLDPEKGRLQGSPIPISDNIADVGGNHHFDFSVSENGTILYQYMDPRSQLTWFDRSGVRIGTIGEPGRYASINLSPDEQSVAIEVLDQDNRDGDIWIFQLSRGTASRFTFDPNWDLIPVWSPDGSSIIFGANRIRSSIDLYQRTLRGEQTEQVQLESIDEKFPTTWTPDGKYLIYQVYDEKTRGDIYALPLSGERRPKALIKTPFDESGSQISPDGRWIAYSSDESGKLELYVQTMPPSGPKWQISNGGGTEPRWRRDGKELFFMDLEFKLMSTEIQAGTTFDAKVPKMLFTTNERYMGPNRCNYTVSSDGQRFLINTNVDNLKVRPIHLILDWQPPK